jgi:hypothetical protein
MQPRRHPEVSPRPIDVASWVRRPSTRWTSVMSGRVPFGQQPRKLDAELERAGPPITIDESTDNTRAAPLQLHPQRGARCRHLKRIHRGHIYEGGHGGPRSTPTPGPVANRQGRGWHTSQSAKDPRSHQQYSATGQLTAPATPECQRGLELVVHASVGQGRRLHCLETRSILG